MTHLRPGRDLGRRGRGAATTPRATGMFAPEVLGPTVDRLGRAGRRWARARAGDRHRPGRRAAGRAWRARSPASSCRRRWWPAAREGRRGHDPGRDGRHGDRPAEGSFTLVYLVFNTISNLLTQDEQVACFAQRRWASRARRPVRGRAVGARAAPAAARRAGDRRRPRGRLHPDRHLRRPAASTSSPTTSPSRSPAGGRPASGAVAAPLHLAERAGPDGAAGRVRAGESARRLGGRGVHGRVALSRLGLPAQPRRGAERPGDLSGPRAGSPASGRRRRRSGRRPLAPARSASSAPSVISSPGREDGDAGRVRRHQLGADPAHRLGRRHGLGCGEEGLAAAAAR